MNQGFGSRPGLLPGAPAPDGEPGAEAGPPATPARHNRRAVVLGAIGAVVVAAAGLTFLKVAGGGAADEGLGGQAVSQRPAPAATATTSATSTSVAVVPVAAGRNPFLDPSAVGAGSGSTAPGTSPAAVPSSTSTPSATVTVTASPVYLGLYGFTTSPARAEFWLNATEHKVAEGTAFDGVRYVEKTSARCARIRYRKTTSTICSGEVKKLS